MRRQSKSEYLIDFFLEISTFLSRFYVRLLEYSYVFSDLNILFRREVRSYPKKRSYRFLKIGVSEA
jgi:hypothetical protein